MKQKFSIGNLNALDDGKVQVALDRELTKIANDMSQRPGDKTARKLQLEVMFTPSANELGNCDAAMMEFTIKTVLPPRRSATYSVGVAGNGTLVFNDASPDNVNQGTLDESTGEVLSE